MDGRRLSFEEQGIYNGVFVMRDRETGTLWSHYTGEAFDGPLKGTVLEWIQLERAERDRAVAEWPDATVPRRGLLRYRSIPPLSGRARTMGNQLPPNFADTMPAQDSELKRHVHGLGVALGRAHRFYPLDALAEAWVVNDVVDEVPVVVMLQDGPATAAAYSRCVAGQTLSFSSVEHGGDRALRDHEGTVWTARGSAVAGPRKGEQLTPVRSIVTDWYGWGAYFPKTTVHGAKP